MPFQLCPSFVNFSQISKQFPTIICWFPVKIQMFSSGMCLYNLEMNYWKGKIFIDRFKVNVVLNIVWNWMGFVADLLILFRLCMYRLCQGKFCRHHSITGCDSMLTHTAPWKVGLFLCLLIFIINLNIYMFGKHTLEGYKCYCICYLDPLVCWKRSLKKLPVTAFKCIIIDPHVWKDFFFSCKAAILLLILCISASWIFSCV